MAPPAGGWAHLDQLAADARKATKELQDEGIRVRFVRSIFVPEDEKCFHLYEAESARAARAAARRAGLAVGALVKAVPAMETAEGESR